MTIQEFDATGWKPGIKARWKEDGEVYRVGAVDFGEKLVALRPNRNPEPDDETQWARCENVTIVTD